MNSLGLQSIVLPQFFPAHWLETAPDMVFSDFPSVIRIGYVLREGDAYSYVMRDSLLESGLSLKTLHDSALANLSKLPTPSLSVAKTPGFPAVGMMSTRPKPASRARR